MRKIRSNCMVVLIAMSVVLMLSERASRAPLPPRLRKISAMPTSRNIATIGSTRNARVAASASAVSAVNQPGRLTA